MKILFIILVFLLIFSCEKNPTSVNTSLGKIYLTTDKDVYSQTDSVLISIDNKSGYDMILGYRCTFKNLEIYFQKKENGNWSENQWFGYMSLRCMTLLRKIKKNKTVKHSISSNEFNTIGTFRLLVPCHIPERDTATDVISNSFEIK